mmetsp:Transcript_41575/g.130211  ORF Transcript_41575/g.130211 Transcript_41575/m.130211 type:complete len:87 (-) Transcript_41575:1595-1855(-)
MLLGRATRAAARSGARWAAGAKHGANGLHRHGLRAAARRAVPAFSSCAGQLAELASNGVMLTRLERLDLDAIGCTALLEDDEGDGR